MLKKAQQKKLTQEEFREQAIFEIFSFYARQHIRKGVDFEQFQEQQRMDKGELAVFCKDFGFTLPKSKIVDIYKRVSKQQTSLVVEQFEEVLPIVAVEFCQEKSREVKARLRELKNVLEYPENTPENRPNQELVLLIEEIDHVDPIKSAVPQRRNIAPRKRIEQYVNEDEAEQERKKSDRILQLVEQILK